MNRIGLILIALSFLVGSYITVLREWTVNWTGFLPVLAVGLVGVALVQLSQRRQAQEQDKVEEDIQSIEESLEKIVKDARQLDKDKDQIPIYELHEHIDEIFIEDLNNFVERRESIGHAYSLQDYADIMSHYAAGERYLNRVWSTSVDGYIDEAHKFVTRAEQQFTQAYDRLKSLREDSQNPSDNQDSSAESR